MSEPNRTKTKQCAGTRKDGSPCTAFALPDSLFCFAHCPSRKAERDEARSRGGRNRASVVRLRGTIPPRLIPIFDRLERALEETHEGTLDPKRAQAIASLARAMTTVLTSGELEQRIRDLESDRQAVKERQGWRA